MGWKSKIKVLAWLVSDATSPTGLQRATFFTWPFVWAHGLLVSPPLLIKAPSYKDNLVEPELPPYSALLANATTLRVSAFTYDI